jgi:hypothetical protein
LCSATSKTRLTICTVPARLVVGVRTKVSRSGAVRRHLIDQAGGRYAVGLEHEAGILGLVPITQLLEQRFLGGPGPAWPRRHGEIGFPALSEAQAPAGILAGEAGEHRARGVHANLKGPFGKRRTAGQRHLAQAAHAELGDTAPGFEPAGMVDSGIDDRGTGRPAHPEAQGRRVLDQARDERSGQAADARAVAA